MDTAYASATNFTLTAASDMHSMLWSLHDSMHSRFRDGQIIHSQFDVTAVFYPEWWLKRVGYFNKHYGNASTDDLPFPQQSGTRARTSITLPEINERQPARVHHEQAPLVTIMCIAVVGVLCFVAGRYSSAIQQQTSHREHYSAIRDLS